MNSNYGQDSCSKDRNVWKDEKRVLRYHLKRDFNSCLEVTRRIGGMDEVLKMPGRWSNEQKAGRGYLYHCAESSKTDDCHKFFIQVNP